MCPVAGESENGDADGNNVDAENVFDYVDLECERGTRRPVRVQDPKKPSRDEIAEHELTHLPFRSWCAHCVRGKGRVADHRRSTSEKGLDEIHIDYCFMGAADADHKETIIVAKHVQTGSIMSSVVPMKGITHEFPAKRIKAFCKEMGLDSADIVLKGDQEPALQDLIREVGRVRAPAKTIPEESPVGSSQSNGHAERAAQSVEGQVRVLKDALETRLGCKVQADSDILAWLVEYASVLLNRYCVSHDGLTPYERLKGKKSKLIGLEFGERLHYRKQRIGNRLAKLDVMWADGVFLGYRANSGEIVIGTPQGVMRTRTIRRRPEDERWTSANLELAVGVPWRPDAGEGPRGSADAMPSVLIEPVAPEISLEQPVAMDKVPLRMYVRSKDIEKYGPSSGCPGCRALLRGGRTQTHSDECRTRVMKEIEESGDVDNRIKAQRLKETEFMEEVLRKSDEKRGMKRAADEANDAERINRAETADRGIKRGAEGDDGGASKRPGGPASSNSSGAGVQVSGDDAGRPQGAPVAEPGPALAQGEETTAVDSDMGINELREIGEEIYNFKDIFAVNACRSPEEDLDDTWDDDMLGAWDGDDHVANFLDDKTGKILDPAKVREAREDELRELESRVFQVVDEAECWAKKGKKPIAVRWVDIDKGFGVYRSRLVAKDFKPKSTIGDRDGLFAAMPPLEAVKLLVVQAAVDSQRGGPQRKLMFIDIGKAHLYGPMNSDEYVDLPPERWQEGKCAKLLYTLYGMRMAATNWEREYSNTMADLGFRKGKASSVTFFNELTKVRVVVHGDDFILEGEERELWRVHDELKKKYIVKMRGVLGPGKEDAKEVVVLNRVLAWDGCDFSYEADPRHVEMILRDLELESCKAAATPGVKQGSNELRDETLLDRGRHSVYRSVVARGNFLAQDRPDIRFAVKELCRRMSAPRECDWTALKRFGRYLKGKPRMVQHITVGGHGDDVINVYVGKDLPNDIGDAQKPVIDIVVDSDWAGCRDTRRSTSGGCVIYKGVCLKVWSTTQQHIALSSGEAEYYAAVKGGSEGLFLENLCEDLGISARVVLHTDSSACKGMCNRDGVGKLRHIELQYLWLQQAVRAGRFAMRKIPGERNPADLLTKFLSAGDMETKLKMLGMEFRDGRTQAVDNI